MYHVLFSNFVGPSRRLNKVPLTRAEAEAFVAAFMKSDYYFPGEGELIIYQFN